MKGYIEIVDVIGREIMDSRGNPTVEVEVYVEGDTGAYMGRAAVPSGASTGIFEACELRDGDKSRYNGKGVLKAVDAVNGEIAEVVIGMNALDQQAIDKAMIEADGTPNKTKFGANAILGVSLAVAKAAAEALSLPLYNYIGGCNAKTLPMPMMNILNGGAHATNNVEIQEFMIMPVSAPSFREALRRCAEVFHQLKTTLKENGTPAAGVGDEGGYAPNLKKDEDALKVIVQAIEEAGYKPGEDFMIAIDAASSEWWNDEEKCYIQPKSGKKLTQKQLVNMWKTFADKYPIISLEDGMGSSQHAHALANVKNPHEQGTVAMIGVFIDTFVVLTMTALVVISTLYAGNGPLAHGAVDGISKTNMAQLAFSSVFGDTLGNAFVAICLLFFAFSTIVGWNLFGRINVNYLFGKKANLAYSIIAIIFIFLGSCLSNDLVWELTDMFNQLMVLPNMIALVALSGIVAVAARKRSDEHELRK